jgi:hypothetical protein
MTAAKPIAIAVAVMMLWRMFMVSPLCHFGKSCVTSKTDVSRRSDARLRGCV